MLRHLWAWLCRFVADRLLLASAPRVPGRARRLHWAASHASERGRLEYQARYNAYAVLSGRMPPATPWEVSVAGGTVTPEHLAARPDLRAGIPQPDRRSVTYPTYASMGHGRHPGLRRLPKPTPFNIRRFSETPPCRRAINKIKNAVLGLEWEVVPRDDVYNELPGKGPEEIPLDVQQRIDAVVRAIRYPNSDESYFEVMSQLLEDVLVGGFGAAETQLWDGNALQPFRWWAVDGMTIRINLDWRSDRDPAPERALRYSQALALGGVTVTSHERVELFDQELCYVRFDPRSSTPFGLGPTEVAFQMINAWLGAMDARERMESNDIPPFWLQLGENMAEQDIMAFRAYWENEIEGMGKIPITGGSNSPEAIMLRQPQRGMQMNAWPELTLRMIAISFGLAPQTFGVEKDVNRNCNSDDTETLTSEGWLSLKALLDGSEVIARNPRTGAEDRRLRAGLLVAGFNPEKDRIEFVEPTLMHVAPYVGDMVHLQSLKYDTLTTPDHRMWIRGQSAKEYHIETATETTAWQSLFCARVAPAHATPAPPAPETFVVPGCLTGRTYGPDYPPIEIDLKLWMEFLGFYLSEGYVSPTAPRHFVVLTQQVASAHAERMQAMLDALPVRFHRREAPARGEQRSDCIVWQVGAKQLANWIRAECGGKQDDRRIPDFVWELPADHQAILFDALMAGDGCWYNQADACVAHQAEACRGYYVSASKALADDVQRLALFLGHRAQVTQNPRGHWRVNIALDKHEVTLGPANITRVPYAGPVYCFDVPPHHLFVSRRNGKVAIHGNTATVMNSEEFADAVRPVVDVMEDALTQHFIWKLCGWADLQFKFKTTVKDEKEAAAIATALFAGDVCTLNEAREKAMLDALPPSDPRGDMFLTQIRAAEAPAMPAPPGGDPFSRLASEQGALAPPPAPPPAPAAVTITPASVHRMGDLAATDDREIQTLRFLATQVRRELSAATSEDGTTPIEVDDPDAFERLAALVATYGNGHA